MNRERAMKVANAVLYEGYMLYPYRPSALKNRQRWSFGILYPPAYHEVAAHTERSQMHSEVLAKITGDQPELQIELRFLQLVEQENGDEGVERSTNFGLPLDHIGDQTRVPRSSHPLAGVGQFEAESTPPPPPTDGEHGALQVFSHRFNFAGSEHREVCGTISVNARPVGENILKLAIDVANTSSMSGAPDDRNSALLTSLLSAHTILSVTDGEFISLLDPPENLQDLVSQCQNVGNFPVLVGAEGERDMMLCSPIVLYDYPQVAPESAGDFFDSTEMDEMLTLRVMTMTDEEKNEMRAAGDHARELLRRTEASAREQLMRTHGTTRSMRQVEEP